MAHRSQSYRPVSIHGSIHLQKTQEALSNRSLLVFPKGSLPGKPKGPPKAPPPRGQLFLPGRLNETIICLCSVILLSSLVSVFLALRGSASKTPAKRQMPPLSPSEVPKHLVGLLYVPKRDMKKPTIFVSLLVLLRRNKIHEFPAPEALVKSDGQDMDKRIRPCRNFSRRS